MRIELCASRRLEAEYIICIRAVYGNAAHVVHNPHTGCCIDCVHTNSGMRLMSCMFATHVLILNAWWANQIMDADVIMCKQHDWCTLNNMHSQLVWWCGLGYVQHSCWMWNIVYTVAAHIFTNFRRCAISMLDVYWIMCKPNCGRGAEHLRSDSLCQCGVDHAHTKCLMRSVWCATQPLVV